MLVLMRAERPQLLSELLRIVIMGSTHKKTPREARGVFMENILNVSIN